MFIIFLLGLFFSILNFTHASDLKQDYSDLIIESHKAPVPHPLRKTLKKIENFKHYSQTGEINCISVVTYPLLLGEEQLENFSKKLDEQFFSSYPKKVIGFSAFSGIVGGIVPHPSCGYIIDSVGNFLQIPVSGLGSKLLISWITVSTTPTFMVQFYNLGKKFFSFLTHNKKFISSNSEKDMDPHFLKWSSAHYLAKGALLSSSLINGITPLFLMQEAEKDYLLFFYITAAPFYVAWVENYYKIGSFNIDYLFRFYRYTVKSNFEKREILKKKILLFKEAINSDENLSENIYNSILFQKEKNYSNNNGDPFCLSLLFCRNYALIDTNSNLDESESNAGYLLNFKRDSDSHANSPFDDIVDWVSPFIMGAGIYTHYSINEYLIQSFFKEIGVDANAAFVIGTTLASFEAVYKATMSTYSQRSYFKSWKNLFTKQGNFPLIRKGLNGVSFVNGVLFSLPSLVAGLHVFKSSSVLNQIFYLVPSFLIDLSYYDGFFSNKNQNWLTKILTLKEKNLGVIGKQAYLNFYADKIYKDIDKFDFETIEKLYKITQQGI